jgi:oligopeptidase B
MKPPVAKKVPRVETRHGRRVRDDYYWLRDRSDPDVLAYLEAENAYTEGVMQRTAALQETLYGEILGRIKETDRSVPAKDGPYLYYVRTVEGKPYAIHCRTPVGSNEEQILLDENELAEGRAYFRLGAFETSPDHGLLAYSYDDSGDEKYVLHFLDLRTGRLLDDVIRETYDSAEWAADGRTVFYNTLDDAHRPFRLWRHVLGRDPADDTLVFEESDEAFYLSLYKTKSRRFLMLCLDSNTTSEVRFLDAADPEGEFRTVLARKHRVEYTVGHREDRFYILTNEEAVNFKLLELPVADPEGSSGREILPHRREVKLDEVQVFANHIVVVERERGLRGIRVIDLPSLAQHKVEFPEPVYTVASHVNPEFDTEQLRFTYTSLVTPDSVFDYDMRTRTRVLRKQREVVGGYDAAGYRSERLSARAPDGTAIPISIVYRADRPAGPGPLLLYAYGSYGTSIDPEFESARLSLLDRGFAYAIAHVRGGGDMGRPWYDAGKLLSKKNTFDDFVACAEHLIGEGYTSRDRLVMRGASAGGLLIGAVNNMRPDLFRAAIAKVPFVDVVNTLCDPSIPLTVIEWEEWGDPRRAEDHDYILSYSPYDNVAAKDYPDLLIMAGLNDPRVAYWEPAKWAAKLRALKTDPNLLLLKTNMGAGHAGASGRYERIRELAFEYAFLLDRVGIST